MYRQSGKRCNDPEEVEGGVWVFWKQPSLKRVNPSGDASVAKVIAGVNYQSLVLFLGVIFRGSFCV